MNRLFMGLDPGQSGGLATVFYDGGWDIESVKMPTTEKDVFEWIRDQGETMPVTACIEVVHAMPGNGVSSMFKFGKGYGGLRMALIAARIPFEEVQPAKWMRVMGVTPRKKTESKTQFKNRLKAKCQQLFPNEQVTLNTCDAILIAEFCRRTHG